MIPFRDFVSYARLAPQFQGLGTSTACLASLVAKCGDRHFSISAFAGAGGAAPSGFSRGRLPERDSKKIFLRVSSFSPVHTLRGVTIISRCRSVRIARLRCGSRSRISRVAQLRYRLRVQLRVSPDDPGQSPRRLKIFSIRKQEVRLLFVVLSGCFQSCAA